jgi:hypothetical protein
MKTYIEFYNFWKNFSLNSLDEIRREICFQGKSELNSLKLEVIDDLCYLKHNGIGV